MTADDDTNGEPAAAQDKPGDKPDAAQETDQARKDGEPKESGDKDGQEKDDADDQDSKKGGGRRKWPLVLGGLVAVVAIAAVLWIIFRPRPDVWTDDAYVMAHYTSIAPRISGQIDAVLVDDNQPVKAGQLLATLDPRDYQAALDVAEATVGRDRAQVEDMSANVARQPSLIDEQKANLASVKARLAFAEADARRFSNLAVTGAGSVQQHQQADMTLRQAEAQRDSADAMLRAAQRQLDVLRSQRKTSEATVRADEARLEQARLNLSYTRILAPFDGTVGQRAAQVGNIVSPGATLMSLVPLDRVYITANYREVDLIHVRPGQPVTIHVDAYDIDLKGIVEGIAPASGASYAPIQPNNATGNFTKIVQRLPVKITVTPDQPLARLLRVGFSVETTIHTALDDVVGQQRGASGRVTEP
ncbi:MAG: biotin/lipoyl-binding protein [Parafilimonas terrae]|nr:biotin/lipoyl-binding protein [Parafilimonas terrae]